MYIISGIRYASFVIKAPLATARAPLRDDTVHLSVRPFVRPSVPKMRTKAQFSQKLSKIKLWSPTKSPTWAFQKNPLQDPITAPLKFKIADGRYTENSFFVHDSVADCPILVKFCTRKHVTTAIQAAWQKSKFRKFKMADSNHLKIVKSLYLNEKPSDFDEIWYTNADLELGDSHVRDQIWKFLKFKMADAAIFKIVFWR